MISHFQTTRISIISHLPFTEQDFGSKIKNPITFSQYFYVLLFPNPAARDKLSENNLHSMQEILACGKYLRHKKGFLILKIFFLHFRILHFLATGNGTAVRDVELTL